MELDEVIKNRTSCRTFLSEPISDEDIEAIVNAGRLAPSSKNAQQWKFVCLKTSKHSVDIANIMKDYYVKNQDNPQFKHSATVYSTGKILEDCPALILVFEDCENIDREKVEDISAVLSIGACVEHMALKATDLNIASLWIADTWYVRDKIADYILDILKGTNKSDFINYDNRLLCALALGKRAEPQHNTPRKDLNQILTIINDSTFNK